MFALPTASPRTDRSKLITTVGHVSIIVVFCVVLAAMGLTAAPAAPENDEALVPAPTVNPQNKFRARRIPTADWAPASPATGDAATCTPAAAAAAEPRLLVCRSFSLLQLEPLSEFDLSAPATSSCGRTITLWTY